MFQLLLIAALAAVIPAPAAVPVSDIVVSAQWLKAHVNDPDLVVLDLTMSGMDVPDPYSAGHVPGSRPLDFHSIFTGDGTNGTLSMELASADSLTRVLQALGVTDRSTIVLYSTSKWLSPVARAYVTLDYLGLGARTHILDGGYEAWKMAGGAVETVTPVITPGSLHLTPRRDVVTNGAYVKAHLTDPNTTIVDARAPEFYAGTARGHSAARAGHVAGAHNLYFLTLADSVANTYLTTDQARARFVSAGVPLDKPIVVYCHIGQTASVDYVQLKRLGVPVRLYDGSFEDWSRNADYPVVMGDRP
jgi:thiosulfate/3-mercaptopyruvate sulfurtransferase